MSYTTTLRPVLASLEEAVSYLACGLWDRFTDLDPWDMEDASALLCKLAHRGLVQLTGSLQYGTVGPIGIRCDVPPSFFLYPVEFEHEVHKIIAIDDHPRWPHCYVEVQVCAQSLMDAAPQPLSDHTSNATIADVTACKKWLMSSMRDSPKHRTMTKENAMATWRQMGRNISDKAFGRAWSSAISETNAPAWSLAGRPKKNPTR